MQEENVRRGDNKYTQLINNLEENGIGVKKLTEECKFNRPSTYTSYSS